MAQQEPSITKLTRRMDLTLTLKDPGKLVIQQDMVVAMGMVENTDQTHDV